MSTETDYDKKKYVSAFVKIQADLHALFVSGGYSTVEAICGAMGYIVVLAYNAGYLRDNFVKAVAASWDGYAAAYPRKRAVVVEEVSQEQAELVKKESAKNGEKN